MDVWRLKMKRSLLLAFGSVLSSAAFATFPNQSIDTFFTLVGQVGNTTSTSGSGTIISPQHVLTARHVGGGRFWMRNDGQNISGFVDSIGRINHPTADISILTFAPNTFASYSRPLYGNHLGSTPTIVGFGLTAAARAAGTGYDVVSNSGSRRRVTTNTADILDEGLNGPLDPALFYDLDGTAGAPGDANSMGSDDPIAGEGGVLPGDSGGAWFLNSGGNWRIIAVNSFIFNIGGGGATNDFLDWGDGGGGVDLNSHSAWLEANAPVPEPASMVVLGLGVAVMARRRRKR